MGAPETTGQRDDNFRKFKKIKYIQYEKQYMQALALSKTSRNFMKKSFSYRGAVAWNNLPDDITMVYMSNFQTVVLKFRLINIFYELNDVV